MKKKFILFALIVVFSLVFVAGCSDSSDSEDDTYVVWTDFSSYSEFQQDFNTTLADGYYARLDLNNAQFSQIAEELNREGAEYRHEWTQSEIKSWFLGRGFDSSTAEKEASWIATNAHGMIVSRSGNTVYYILK